MIGLCRRVITSLVGAYGVCLGLEIILKDMTMAIVFGSCIILLLLIYGGLVHILPTEDEERRLEQEEGPFVNHPSSETDKKSFFESRERAKRLFLSKLTPEQLVTQERYGFITVRGKNGCEYRIDTTNLYFNVLKMSPSQKIPIELYCAHPSVNCLPRYDHLLAQKLLIETNSRFFHRKANKKDLDEFSRTPMGTVLLASQLQHYLTPEELDEMVNSQWWLENMTLGTKAS